jgi:TolB-like protein
VPDIFLSYSREDQAAAQRFADAFAREGLDVWWDATLRSGEAYDEVTEKALRDAKAVVVLWSRKSVVSRWVRAEATLADRNRTLIPVMIEACERPIMFELTQSAELVHWQGASEDRAWRSFLADVRRFLEARSAARPAASAPAPAPAPVAAKVAPKPGRIAVAVLPFANMSGDAEQEYFSDGISEDIITDLSKISSLSVISRNSAFTFKGKHVDLPQVARQLQVTHVLEGSVRRSGNRVRITAQLIDGATNNHVWAERYDRDLSDIFALQDEISQAIVVALKLKLVPAEKKALSERGTESLAAYDKYLRGLALLNKGAQSDDAADLFRESLAIDPGFVDARSALIRNHGQRLVLAPQHLEQTIRELGEMARYALAHHPYHWSGYLAQALYCNARGDRLGAEQSYGAMQDMVSGTDPNTLWVYSIHVCSLGRIAEGVRAMEAARDINPLALDVASQLVQYLYIAGRVDEAKAEYARVLEIAGGREPLEHMALFWTWESGDLPAIKQQFRRFIDCQSRPMPVMEELLRTIEQPAEALESVRRAFDDPANQDPTRIMLLSWHAALLGDTALALAALRRCYVDMNGVYRAPLWYPLLREVRRTPEFKQLLRELGIYQCWRESGKWADFARPISEDDFEVW